MIDRTEPHVAAHLIDPDRADIVSLRGRTKPRPYSSNQGATDTWVNDR